MPRRIPLPVPLHQHVRSPCIDGLKRSAHRGRRMTAKHGPVESLASEKPRRCSLLPQLNLRSLLELVQLRRGKAGMQQNIQSYGKPGIKILAQAGGSEDRFGRTETRPGSHRRAKAIEFLGDLPAGSLVRAFAKQMGGGRRQAGQVVGFKKSPGASNVKLCKDIR